MHTSPPPAFRCHRCGLQVRSMFQGLGLPAIYTCGHRDKLADLTVDDSPPYDWSGLASGGSNYLPAATADPDRFREDFLLGLRVLAGDSSSGV